MIQRLLHLIYQQKNLHPFLLLTQKSTLPVYVTQACLIYSHIICQPKQLPHFLLLNQISSLPVEVPQGFHHYSHLTYKWGSLSQLYHIHQVPLPVEIPTHSRNNKHQSNSLKLFPLNKSSQVFHHHSFLITHHWYLFWILIFLPVLSPVTFQVLIPKIYSSLLIHMLYPNIHLQDPISCHLLFQRHLPPSNLSSIKPSK